MRSSTWAIFLLPAVLCVCVLHGQAQANQLTIEPLPPDSGGAGIAVVFHPSPEPIAALEFEIEYDSALSLFPSAGMATRESAKYLSVAEPSPNRKKFVIVGLNQGPIQGGVLVALLPSADSTAPPEDLGLRVSSVRAVYGNGAAASISGEGQTLQLRPEDLVPLGVLNAASLLPSPVWPDAILTLAGRGIGPQDGVHPPVATIDGAATDVLYAGSNQINLIGPSGFDARETAQIDVVRDGSPLAYAHVPAALANPALFTLSGSGTGQAAALHQDGSVNGPENPASKGSVVVLLGTGIGPADARLPVSVTIGGVPAAVEYSGAAPGAIRGLFQVNCRIPEDAEPGPAVEVRVTAGIYRSPPGVTIGVK